MLHFLIFNDIPMAFEGGGAAGEIARISFDISDAATTGTMTSLRLCDIIPSDASGTTVALGYEGVRGTTIADTDAQSWVPAVVNGTFTVTEPGPVENLIGYLLGIRAEPPDNADANADGLIDISDAIELIGE